MRQNYTIIPPKGKKVPILVSVPHCGTAFPEEVINHFKKEKVAFPDDTDFFVEKVYDFVSELGITMIYAHYNRWVIDLNRSPHNQNLYDDGRIITSLTPTTDFLGNPIYKARDFEPDGKEIQRRKENYYLPYYDAITKELNNFKKEFGVAVLWDAHSIRRLVPTIQSEPFPSFILGTNDGRSANGTFIAAAKQGIATSGKECFYNTPFKGGNITRHFGNPAENIHALQLEMIKPLYMDDTEINYHPKRAEELKRSLKTTFELLIKVI